MKKTKSKKSSPQVKTEDATSVVIGKDVQVGNLENNEPQINRYYYFCTPVYHVNVPQFLPKLREIAEVRLEQHRQEVPELHPVFPIRQTNTLLDEPELKDFFDFVGYNCFQSLVEEGYHMQELAVIFQEAWLQEHHKHSGHDEHVHGYGSQLVGFYFLNTPEDSGRLVFHDPRPAKRQINLPEADHQMASDASTAINFNPKEGDLFFAPSWVPHSISRHVGDEPLRMVHMTLSVNRAEPHHYDTQPPASGPNDQSGSGDSSVTVI